MVNTHPNVLPLPVRTTHRRLTLERSFILAVADAAAGGPVVRRSEMFTLRYAPVRCVGCGFTLGAGDHVQYADRPGYENDVIVCARSCRIAFDFPADAAERPNFFTLMPWLARWAGADIVTKWVPSRDRSRCQNPECGRTRYGEELMPLVRLPRSLAVSGVHSRWHCVECVKL